MNFGPQTSEPDSHAIMDAAHDVGINFFDTANAYGGADHRGHTEEIIGNWFASGGGRRERTVIATKLYGDMDPLAQQRQAVRAQHPARPGRQPEAAADRLHRPLPVPPRRPGHPVGGDLAGRRGGGRSRARSSTAGSSNFAGWHIAQAQEAAAGGSYLGLVSRAVAVQPDGPDHRARGDPGRGALRPRHHPLVTAARRPARRRDPQAERGRTPAGGSCQRRRSRSIATRSQAYEDLAGRAGHRARRAGSGLAAAADRPSPLRSSGRGSPTSWTAPSGRSSSSSTRPRWTSWTRSSPVTRRRRRTTPGRRWSARRCRPRICRQPPERRVGPAIPMAGPDSTPRFPPAPSRRCEYCTQ